MMTRPVDPVWVDRESQEHSMSQEETFLNFPKGLSGFPHLRTFRLLEPAEGYPLKFLQSIEDSTISFVCMDAAATKMDYEVPLDDEASSLLNLVRMEDALVLVLVVVPDDPRQMTANLAGPLVINTLTLTGLQVELDSRKFPLQYRVFTPMDDAVVHLPAGLVGFPKITSFRLFEPAGGYPLKFLQALGHEELSFVCIDVAAIKMDYQVPLSEADAAFLKLKKHEDALVLALVVIPEDPRRMTANLAGPLVINTHTKQGIQVVLNTEQFPLKHPIFSEA
jgi:flagellar assembly factor FliW